MITKLRAEPDAETLSTSFLINANHFFGRGFIVFRKIHDEEPVVIIAALEENCVGTDLIRDVALR